MARGGNGGARMARRTGRAAWIVVPAGFLFMTCLLLWVGMTIVAS
jgi:hypothetical protein